MILRHVLVFILMASLALPATIIAQPIKRTVQTKSAVPATSAIREDDLRKDLFAMAGDHFRGREAGTLDELKVSVWFAQLARAAGLQPAGDDSTYFQFFSMWRTRVAASSSVRIGDSTFQLWKDVLVSQTAPALLSTPLVYAGNGSKDEIAKTDVKGKAVAVMVSPEGINLNVSLPERRYMGYVYRKYAQAMQSAGAAAIIFIADETGERSWSQVMPALTRGLYDVQGGATAQAAAPRVPVFWMHRNAAGFLQRQGLTFQATINVERFEYPSVNIIGKIPGTDPALSKEYVLFSGHQDHDGVRQLYGQDSIYNGADDNASVSVALLAIARAFHQHPGRRSALFVWHGAEERGLLGSRWFSAHPTVPKTAIVAVLNGDMIGRNTGDSAALLGVQPPHRNSPELVALGLEANREGPNFKLDTLWDKVEHVEGWYFRSDHLPYARAGIPSLFYTTLLHPDYHTPMDEPDRIDINKLKKMSEWMYRTGWKVANIDKRPAVDANFKLER